LGAQHHYRLPHVSEWRRALGVPQTTGNARQASYLWGAKWPPTNGVGNLAGGEWRDAKGFEGLMPLAGYQDGHLHTAPVGTFAANANGFCDLVGNVWELCEKTVNGRTNVVALGGAWNTNEKGDLYLSSGLPVTDALVLDYVGFRCFLADESSKAREIPAGSVQRSSK
jgi:formylglycine-generating enzyme required for sulfatase activity